MAAPNYNSTGVSGEQWQRCFRVIIENPLGGMPSMGFCEQKAFNLGEGNTVTNDIGINYIQFDNNINVPLLDGDGIDTGNTFTHQEVYQMINSLYMYMANLRDTIPV